MRVRFPSPAPTANYPDKIGVLLILSGFESTIEDIFDSCGFLPIGMGGNLAKYQSEPNRISNKKADKRLSQSGRRACITLNR